MATFKDLAIDAYQKIGYYAPGEVMSDADAELALRVANVMLDSWSNESLTCYAILEQSFTLVVGQSQYSIGPGGFINTTRPLKLIDGPGAAYMLDTNGNKYGVEVIPRDKWNLVTSNNQVTANIVSYIFYDPQFPLGLLNVWPQPIINWQLFFDSYLQLVDFTNISSQLSLPPGYQKAIQDSLAVELWPYCYKGAFPPLLGEIASRSKGNIKRTNIRPVEAIYDPELVARGGNWYNVYTDDNSGIS